MGIGPKLVVQGTFFGSLVLSFFLFTISAGASFQAVPALSEIDKAVESKSAQFAMDSASASQLAEAGAENAPACSVSDRFPASILQWCELITEYANKRNLPPDLLAAVIWQESGGDPGAYSHSGAVGLMQVMPRDGIAAGFMCQNGPCFQDRPTIEELQDPAFNIAYGAKLLAGLLERHGDIREALRYYGPMNVGYSYADRVLSIFQQYGRQNPQ